MFRFMMSILLCFLIVCPVLAEVNKTKTKTALKPAVVTTTNPVTLNSPRKASVSVRAPVVKNTARIVDLPRTMVKINSIQFAHLSGDVYSWQATLENLTQAPIAGVVLMLSKKVNGSWSPAGDQVTINSLAAG
ncbi:MAG: hypothetical protein WC394_00515, partial [Candidatus Omnitrophota bacterium]